MHINQYTLVPIGIMLFSLACGTFVLLQNPKARLNQLFLAICLCFAAWFSFYIPYNFNVDDHFLVTWYRLSFCFISFIPITCYTFISTYLQINQNEKIFKINASIGGLLSIVSLTTPYIVAGVWHNPPYPYPKAGPLHCLLVAHCCFLAIHSIILCLNALKESNLTIQRRNHIRYLMCAIGTLSLGIIDFYFNYNGGTMEFGAIAVPGYLLITTIACIKHELMDIRVVIRKSLVYTVTISGIALLYFLSVYFSEHVLERIFNYHSMFVSFFFASMVALMLVPVKDLIEKYLFRKSAASAFEENEHLINEIVKTEKFKTVANLASGIAHEIKNPLATLQTFSELVCERKDDENFMKVYKDIVPKELERIGQLISELLSLSKPAAPRKEKIQPALLIQNLVRMVSHRLKKIKVIIKAQSNKTIEADPNQLKQALLNLILNALDAMPTGGTLTIETKIIKNEFIIIIADTGCGIDPKDQSHIFEPFFTRKEKGTGLGLAVTQGIIEKHGGRIEFHSRPNQGTVFRISLH